MIELRKASQRGRTRIDWLDSAHTFSFGGYHDRRHMGFHSLRVINDDRVAPGGGFAPHGHRDMEIISYVVEGALEHRDSLGNGSVIRPGDVQIMHAGTGIRHSEYNPSPEARVRFLQIWIPPRQGGLAPGYEQRHFDDASLQGALRLVASPDGAEGSVTIHQDARLYAGRLSAEDRVEHRVPEGRAAWVQVVSGRLTVNGTPLSEGDGLGADAGTALDIRGGEGSELLLFDLK
ncbi:MAG: pirin family protein [Alphaproteobacteria bacterium]|nr:pirin family protein [Alphaproteobacteria bacterium]